MWNRWYRWNLASSMCGCEGRVLWFYFFYNLLMFHWLILMFMNCSVFFDYKPIMLVFHTLLQCSINRFVDNSKRYETKAPEMVDFYCVINWLAIAHFGDKISVPKSGKYHFNVAYIFKKYDQTIQDFRSLNILCVSSGWNDISIK